MPILPGAKPRLPSLCRRYSEDEIRDSIERHFGVVTAICNDLDCTYSQFYKAVKKLDLQDFLAVAKRNLISLAEKAIMEELNNP